MKRASKGFTRENIPLFHALIVQGPPKSPTQTLVADETVYKERGYSVERAATTATSLEAEQDSGGSPRRQDTILGDRPAQTRLIKKGRKIAAIDHDPGISLVQHDVKIQGRYGHDMEFDFDASKEVSTADAAVTTASVVVSTVNPTRNTRVPTANDVTIVETMVYIRKSAVKDKGKGKMDESETVQTKTKLQQEQERLSFEAAVRLQAELEEEERQRIVRRLQAEEREKYTEVEQARMLAELINQIKRATEEELDQESSKRQKTDESSELAEEPRDKEFDELSQEELQQIMIIVPEKYWKIIRVGNHTEVHHVFDDMLKAFDMDDLVMSWSLVKEKFNSTEPTDNKEREIWVELKRLFEPDTDDKGGNRHLHAGREGVSIVKGNSYIDAGHKAFRGSR
ncbi:hypothetical protein Tco_1280387 [Tanacetum coccineum]